MLICICGCSSGSKVPTDPKDNTVKAKESTPADIDFKATGNEPSWSLEIDFGSSMHFKSLNHPEDIITPVPEPDIAQDVAVEQYRAVTEKGELIVSIIPDSCMDTMSGDKFPYKVTVAAKLAEDDDYTSFNGCGQYILDSRLHNIWVVEEIEGQKIESGEFSNGLPTLELYAEQGKVSGHDGCNRLFGSIENQKGGLKFSALGSTMMACPNMEKGSQFLKLLSDQTFEYVFEPGHLVLKQGDEVVMRFKNVD